MRTRIKFCGITRARDAQAAALLGVDALGFVLVPASARCIAPQAAARIRADLPPMISVVALFKDAAAAQVQDAIDELAPDLLQFHGDEDAAYCASFGLPYLKAVSMQAAANLKRAAKAHPHAAALLLDSHAQGGMGGSGKTFAWKQPAKVRQPLIVAGGLTPQNVGAAVRAIHPWAVDVSSGIESKPGIKDAAKMRAFVQAVTRADARTR